MIFEYPSKIREYQNLIFEYPGAILEEQNLIFEYPGEIRFFPGTIIVEHALFIEDSQSAELLQNFAA